MKGRGGHINELCVQEPTNGMALFETIETILNIEFGKTKCTPLSNIFFRTFGPSAHFLS